MKISWKSYGGDSDEFGVQYFEELHELQSFTIFARDNENLKGWKSLGNMLDKKNMLST